jgi:GR25 family glycosyltransferase involved in LPS biosynthesis
MEAEEALRAYVINLDRSPDRLKTFLADNSMPGLEFVRMRAIDGQKLDRAELVRRGVIAADLLYSNNSVACSLSHLSCWQEIIKQGKPGLVCEDDAILRRDFVRMHKHFEKTVAQQDIVFWSYNFGLHLTYEVPGLGEFNAVAEEKYLNTPERIERFQATTAPTTLFQPKRIWGLACYTITPSGAEKMMKLVMPLRNGKIDAIYRTGLWMHPRKCTFPNMSLDTDVGLIHINKINARVAVPPVAVHRTLDNVSDIDLGREEDRYQPPFRDKDGRIHVPLPLTSPNVGALNDTGLALHNFQIFAKAIEYYDAALRRAPNIPEPYYNRANSLMAIGRFADAVASYDKAIELRPGYASAHNNRGFALQQLDRFAEAVAAYDKVLELQPDHPRASGNRDEAHRKLTASGDGSKAAPIPVKANG